MQCGTDSDGPSVGDLLSSDGGGLYGGQDTGACDDTRCGEGICSRNSGLCAGSAEQYSAGDRRFSSVPTARKDLPQASGTENGGWFYLYRAGIDSVPDGCEYRFCTCGESAWKRYCRQQF